MMALAEDTVQYLRSLERPAAVAVIGASGGIGGAIVDALAADRGIARIWAASRREIEHPSKQVHPLALDLTEEATIARAAEQIAAAGEPLDLVFVATGILHDGDSLQPEKTWRALDPDALRRSFDVNCIGPALVAKHFLPMLRRDHKAIFAALSARVGSIGDNQLGGWYGYRASKAALNMMIRTLAIELARRNSSAVCVGLHPGTVETDLSRPFQRSVPAERLFPAEQAAHQLLTVIDNLSSQSSGRLFAWDGSEIPF
jgi:NAD(P)-dependent dehydrogenase (short-subunit alcohol dehydrogenase family)